MPDLDLRSVGRLFLVLLAIVMAITVEALILVVLAKWLQSEHLGLAAMPVLAVTGVFGLIGTMVIVVVLFQYIGLASATEALGLPDGSVRAILALSLLVLFGLLTAFLFNSLNDGGAQRHAEKLPPNYTQDAFKKDNPLAMDVTILPSADGSTKDAYWIDPRDQSSTDFAKTLLTIIGTLMTAVTSFYFGANTVASAVATTPTPNGLAPAPTSATPDPPDHTGGANGVVAVTVTGTNLNDITAAKVVNRTTNANVDLAAPPKSNATSVIFDVPGAPLAAGAWDVLLTDKNNKTVTVPNGITLT